MSISIKKNTIYNAIKTCSSILFPIITIPYVNRVLLPDNVGKVEYARSFISYFSLVASLGITTYAIRECAAKRNDKDALGNTASQLFSINIITTIVAYILLAITMLITTKFDGYRSLIYIQCFTILFTTLGAEWLNSAMEDFRFITIRTVAFQILSIVLMYIFVRKESDYIVYSIITVISSSGASLTNIIYRKKYCKIRFLFSIDWKKHITPIFFLFVMTLSQVIFNNADITMIGIIKNDYEVGLYSTAHKIINMISMVVSSVGIVVMPRLSYYFSNNDYENANRLLRKLLGLNIAVGLPCFTFVLMLANDISWLVGGDEFTEAAPVMRILAFCFLFSLIGGSFLGNAILIATKNEKYYMIVCCITAVINVIINAFLIPVKGAIGASIATSINGLLIFILLLFKIDKKIRISRLWSIFVGPIIGSIFISLVCWGCSFISNIFLRSICSAFFGVIMYAFILLLSRNEFVWEYFEPIKRRLSKRTEL